MKHQIDMKHGFHEVKILVCHLHEILFNGKKSEIRKTDRAYEVGDIMKLNEYRDDIEEYTGSFIIIQITHIEKYAQVGHVVLSFDVLK